MSCRRPRDASAQATALRKELDECKKASIAMDREARVAEAEAANAKVPAGVANETAGGVPVGETTAADVPSFSSLSPSEKAAGSLGVHPEAWRPIAFMNAKHYDALLKHNAVDDTLVRRIEAFKHVSVAN